MYWISKMHKKVPKARFIAGSADVLTTKLAQVINVLLMEIKKELMRRDKEHIAETGIKRCWFIDSYEEVISWLELLDRPDKASQCINTYDFSTVCTTLALQDLITCLSSAIREAFQGAAPVSTLCCKWEDNDNREAAVDPESQYLTASHTINLVRTLVLSTYVKNGKHASNKLKVSLWVLIQLAI